MDKLTLNDLKLINKLQNEKGIYKGKVNVYGDYCKDIVIRFHKIEDIEIDVKRKVLFEYGIAHIASFPVKFKDYGKTWWFEEDIEKLNEQFTYNKEEKFWR